MQEQTNSESLDMTEEEGIEYMRGILEGTTKPTLNDWGRDENGRLNSSLSGDAMINVVNAAVKHHKGKKPQKSEKPE